MKDANYYYRLFFKGVEKLFVEIRAELAADLKAGTINQETFDDCDLKCEQCLLAAKEEYQAVESN